MKRILASTALVLAITQPCFADGPARMESDRQALAAVDSNANLVITVPSNYPQSQSQCVNAPLDKVIAATTAYDCYDHVTGHVFKFGPIQAMNLSRSRAIQWAVKPGSAAALSSASGPSAPVADAIVALEFQPGLLDSETSFYPTVAIHCQAFRDSATEFHQDCELDPRIRTRAVSFYRISVTGTQDAGCGAGATKMSYRVAMATPKTEMEEIVAKNKEKATSNPAVRAFLALKPARDAFDAMVAKASGVEVFQDFFQQYYQGWKSDMESGASRGPWDSCGK